MGGLMPNGEYYTEFASVFNGVPTMYFRFYKTREDYENDDYYDDFEIFGKETILNIQEAIENRYGYKIYETNKI